MKDKLVEIMREGQLYYDLEYVQYYEFNRT